MELFARASKEKLRFKTTKGLITTEDLWDLNLEDLDLLAGQLHKAKEDNTVSFIRKKSTASTALDLKFDVVKFVIDTKLTQEEANALAKEKRMKKIKLMDLIARKEEDNLSAKSVEELKKELLELDA